MKKKTYRVPVPVLDERRHVVDGCPGLRSREAGGTYKFIFSDFFKLFILKLQYLT